MYDNLGLLSVSILCVLDGMEVLEGGKETDEKQSHNGGIKFILSQFDKEI